MLERAPQGSMLCRLLGNPLAYRIVCAIGRGRKRPIELSRELRASPSAIVNQLKLMKTAGLVRWHSTGIRRGGRIVEYWLADASLLRVCDGARDVMKRTRTTG